MADRGHLHAPLHLFAEWSKIGFRLRPGEQFIDPCNHIMTGIIAGIIGEEAIGKCRGFVPVAAPAAAGQVEIPGVAVTQAVRPARRGKCTRRLVGVFHRKQMTRLVPDQAKSGFRNRKDSEFSIPGLAVGNREFNQVLPLLSWPTERDAASDMLQSAGNVTYHATFRLGKLHRMKHRVSST